MTKQARTGRVVRVGRRRGVELRTSAVQHRGARRGLAMMLVLIALSVATVVTTAMLTARSMSPHVAENAQNTVSARWSSESAANYAVAMLGEDFDWELLAGDLATDLPIAGGTAKITISNLNGRAPTSDDRDLVVTATAVVDGIESQTQKLVRMMPSGSIEDALDPHLGEFALYIKDSLQIGNGARVRPWGTSPEGSVSSTIRIATSAPSAANLMISSSADIDGAVMYFDTGASFSAPDMLPHSMNYQMLNVALPLVDPMAPSTASLVTQLAVDTAFTGAGEVLLPSGRYQSVHVNMGSVVTLSDDAGDLYEFASFEINKGTVIIDGEVTLIVNDSFRVDKGALEFADDASLHVFVENEARFRTNVGWAAGAAGDPMNDPEMYESPRNMIVCTTGAASRVRIESGARVCAEIHAPAGEVEIGSGARLFGRVAAYALDMQPGSALYYDPTLDNRLGFSSPASPLYDENGDPIVGLESAMALYTGPMEYFAETVTASVLDEISNLVGGGPTEVGYGGWVDSEPIPNNALSYEDGEMYSGAIAFNDSDSDSGLSLDDLGRPANPDGSTDKGTTEQAQAAEVPQAL